MLLDPTKIPMWTGFWTTPGLTSCGLFKVIPTERKAWSSWLSHCMKPWNRIMLTWHRSFSSSVQIPPWETPGVARLMTTQRARPHTTRSWRRVEFVNHWNIGSLESGIEIDLTKSVDVIYLMIDGPFWMGDWWTIINPIIGMIEGYY
jgi:hypothetical protein